MSATDSVVTAYKTPETAVSLSRTIRMLLDDQVEIIGLSRHPVKNEPRILRDGEGEAFKDEDGEAIVIKDEDGEVFEVALENDAEYAVVVVPVGTWSAWRKKIQGR